MRSLYKKNKKDCVFELYSSVYQEKHSQAEEATSVCVFVCTLFSEKKKKRVYNINRGSDAFHNRGRALVLCGLVAVHVASVYVVHCLHE